MYTALIVITTCVVFVGGAACIYADLKAEFVERNLSTK